MKKIIFLLIILSCVAFAQRNKSAMIRFYDTYILRDLRAGTFGGLDTLAIDNLNVSRVKEAVSVKLLGRITFMDTNNSDFLYEIFRNDFDSLVTIVKWDSSSNAMLVGLGTLDNKWDGWEVFPEMSFARVTIAATIELVYARTTKAGVLIDGNLQDVIRYQFYRFSAPQTILTETDITRIAMDINVTLVKEDLSDHQVFDSD